MAAGITTKTPLPALGLLEALTARSREDPAQGKVTPNLPLASQSNANRGSGLFSRAASLLLGSNPGMDHQDGSGVQHREMATCTVATRKTK